MATFIPNVSDTFPEPALFRPDFSFLDRMLSRRQQMYERGFAEVAGKYAELNRPLTNTKNVVERNKFLNEAMTNLKDLSSMDLSQQQNVLTASSVFQPFWKNTHILKDMIFTQRLDQEESLAETYRLKDGGKEFHEDNLYVVQKQRNAFAKANPMEVDRFMNSMVRYTPYVDVDKAIAEHMKNFKPDDVQEMPTLQGFYKITKRDASVRPDQVRRYLESVMTEKEKNQLRIHAIAKLGDNPQYLIGNYANTAQDNVKYLDGQINKISGQIKIEKDPAVQQELKDVRSTLEDRKGSYQKEVERIKSGDVGFLMGKLDDIAYDMFYNAKLSDVAKGYARKNYQIDISENSVAMNIWKENNADRRHRENLADKKLDRELQLRLKELEATGYFEQPDGYNTATLSPNDIKGDGLAGISNARSKAIMDQKAATANFTKFMLNFYRNDKISDENDRLTEQDLMRDPTLVEKFVSKYGNLEAVQNFKQSVNESELQIMTANQLLRGAQDKVKLTEPEQKAIDNLKNELVKKIGANISVIGPNGKFVNIGVKDIYDGILNRSVTMEGRGQLLDLNVNGLSYTIDANSKNPVLNDAVQKIYAIQNSIKGNKAVSGAYDRYRDAINQELGGGQASTVKLGVWEDKKKTAQRYIAQIESAIKGAGVQGDVSVTNIRTADQTNRVYFSIKQGANAKIKFGTDDKFEDITDEKILKKLQTSVGLTPGARVGRDANGFFIDYGSDYSNNRMLGGLSNMERNMLEMDSYTKEYNSPFWYPQGIGNYKDGTPYPMFRYEKVMGFDGVPRYYLYDGNGGSMIGGKEYSSLSKLLTEAKAYSVDPVSLRLQKMR